MKIKQRIQFVDYTVRWDNLDIQFYNPFLPDENTQFLVYKLWVGILQCDFMLVLKALQESYED